MFAHGIGEFVLLASVLYLLASLFLVPFVAWEKGRSGFGWMLIALFNSPLLALIALAAVPDKFGPVPVKVDQPDVDEVPTFKWQKR
jgi:hypothetical protein